MKMEKAIVTGATGFIGSALVRKLLHKDIEVLALGRRLWPDVDPKRLTKSEKLKYVQIDLSEIFNLPERIKEIGWETGDSCVFYNFAWSGVNRLADGAIEDQLKNVTYNANSIVIAKKLGCIKFVNSGTIEETFVEKYLEHNWKSSDYHSTHGTYAISKLAARDMSRLIAYLQKIDYVHTRFSVFIDEDISANGFIPAAFKKIADGVSYDTPKNNQLFDLLPLEEGSKAFYLIGEKGRNKADYFIGSGAPRILTRYFNQFKSAITGMEYADVGYSVSEEQILGADSFSIFDLKNDTGFELDVSFEAFINKMVKK